MQTTPSNGSPSADWYTEEAAKYSAAERPFEAWLTIWRGLDMFPDNGRLAEQLREWTHIVDQSNSSRPRVLHGTMEIASQMHAISQGLRGLGVVSRTLNYYPNYTNKTADYTWDLINDPRRGELHPSLRKLARQLIGQYDIFHFHFGATLLDDNSDLAMLREQGKPCVMHHWGSEVRRLSIARRHNPYVRVKVNDEPSIIQRLVTLSRHIRHCIVPDYELYPHVQLFYDHVHIIPSMIDLSLYKPPASNNPEKKKLLIVHAPTSEPIKGTASIVKAVEQLKSSYPIEFILIRNMPHEQAAMFYAKADLIIDQLHIGSYDLLSIEGMAMGKPVVCYISDYMKEHYPASLPIISATPDTIGGVLRHLIGNADMLEEIGRQSRCYAEMFHDLNTNAGKVLNVYKAITKGGAT